MIDVPVLVKEALRGGNTRKNYRFDVYKSVETDVYSDLGTISETEVAFVINEELPKSDVYLFIYNNGFYGSVNYTAAGGGSSAFYIPEDPTSEIRKISLSRLGLGNFSSGDTITLYGTMTPDSVVDVKYKTGTTTEEVFDFVIDNNNLVKESVRIDERMCSDTNLKFGLCEGTQLEFQCFGVANITNRRLKAYVEVNYINENGVDSWHPVTLGWFTVKECSRQASTGILKVSCYNKLLSDYLDAKANDVINSLSEIGDIGTEGEISIQSLLDALLDGYYIETEPNLTYNTNIYTGVTSYNPAFRLSIVRASQDSYVGTGQYMGVYEISRNLCLDSGMAYSEDKYYRAVIKAKDISDYFKNLANQHVCDEHGVPYLFLDREVSAGEQVSYAYTFEELIMKDPSSVISFMFEKWNSSTPPLNEVIYELSLYENDIEIPITPWVTGLNMGKQGVVISIPLVFVNYSYYPSGSGQITPYIKQELDTRFQEMYTAIQNMIVIEERVLTDIENMRFTNEDTVLWGDVTLRDLQTAVFEMNCQYGKLDRETDLFSGVELNNNRLLPADTLYPADDLYPNSMSERANRAMYSKLWADEGNVRSFRYLIITYKGTEVDPDTGTVSEVEKKLQRTVNTHGTDDYNMSDNWLFKNLVWADEDVGDYADAMVEKMRNITWFPFEMWCAGLPYIETGDEVEISVGQNTYTSYVLRRNLKGIQNLQDEMINGTLDIF